MYICISVCQVCLFFYLINLFNFMLGCGLPTHIKAFDLIWFDLIWFEFSLICLSYTDCIGCWCFCQTGSWRHLFRQSISRGDSMRHGTPKPSICFSGVINVRVANKTVCQRLNALLHRMPRGALHYVAVKAKFHGSSFLVTSSWQMLQGSR